MIREMYVSSAPHETKVALVEDDQLAELFFELENEYTLAGSIYKGRVTRVLPGMQSAFVDIGLERDAFLYVSDFLEVPEDEEDEFGEIAVSRPETFVTNRPLQEQPRFEVRAEAAAPAAEPAEADSGQEFSVEEETGEEFSEAESSAEGRPDEQQGGFRGNRRRRRTRRGRGFPDAKFARPAAHDEQEPAEQPGYEAVPPAPRPVERSGYAPAPILLPGESISKYQKREEQSAAAEGHTGEVAEAPAAEVTPVSRETQPAEVEPRHERESRSSFDDYQPRSRILLPGESIAKYQPKAEPSPSAEPEAEPSPTPPSSVEASEVAEAAAEPEHPAPVEEPRAAAFSGYQPRSAIVLPGESIAKYNSRPEPELTAEPEAAELPAPAPSAEVMEAAIAAPAPVEEMQAAAVEPDLAEDRPESRASYRERELKPAYVRTERAAVLPGESIAKYQAKTEELSLQQAVHAAEDEERLVQKAATFVIESEPWSESLEREVSQLQPAPDLPVEKIPEHQDIIAWSERHETTASAETPVKAGGERTSPQWDKFEQMNVAAAFGGDALESEEQEYEFEESTTESGSPARLTETDSFVAPGTSVHAPARDEHVFGSGMVEHEEIEGDEADIHPPSDEESDSDYIELVEESFESHGGGFSGRAGADARRLPKPGERVKGQAWGDSRDGAADAENGGELTEAVEETDIDRATLSAAYEGEEGGDFDEDLSFEEEELVEGEEAELPEEQQEEAMAGGQAEVRAPGNAPGYQRPARPFDRRRGRRGGPGSGPRRVIRRHEQPRQNVQISDLLKEGQEVLVQIAKEPIGKKGARITSHIALPGRFLVYMPTVNHVGVSRKIASDEERQRLKRIMISEREGGHGGFIVRTAAAGIGEDELRADIRFLKNLWAQIKHRAETDKAPALIYHDLNLVERTLRDLVTSDFSQVWVDNELEYERVLNFANRFQPSLVRRVKLYTKETPLFEQFGIQEEINKALKPKVWLKSGGYIVINQTEALVAIDVNTGKYVGKTARLEDTIVKTNVDAIKEIVRQVRLRDLGGIIVVDFIDMDERRNRQKVMQALEEALRYDRSPSKVLAFNDFGLVAITRKRVKQSLERTLGSPCPYCGGGGYVKSVTTVCNEIFTELRKMRRQLAESDTVNLRVNTEVAKALKTSGGRRLQECEELTGRTILVKADPLLHQEQFDIH